MLWLSFSVELSSFTGQRQQNLPPPSQENTVSSVVDIPDGHTIVVGGLNRTELRHSVDAVPILGSIPGLRHLFRSVSDDEVNATLFVFIKATVLRDDRFRDLKHISAVDMEAADVNRDYPTSEPLLIQPAATESRHD
jgi:type II secretory pathway component GspD/PulD (secretin)